MLDVPSVPWTITGSVDREQSNRLTPLGQAAYTLFLPEVKNLLARGADPHRKSSFGGGSSPVLLAIAGYVDKVEDCAPQLDRFYAHECVHILEALRREEAAFEIPASVYLDPVRHLELVTACAAARLEELRQELIRL